MESEEGDSKPIAHLRSHGLCRHFARHSMRRSITSPSLQQNWGRRAYSFVAERGRVVMPGNEKHHCAVNEGSRRGGLLGQPCCPLLARASPKRTQTTCSRRSHSTMTNVWERIHYFTFDFASTRYSLSSSKTNRFPFRQPDLDGRQDSCPAPTGRRATTSPAWQGAFLLLP